ncbi:pyridoxal kinase PdxY [Rhodovibrionaceae bacterium A322]
MNILSIQSHVAHGYVGNRPAVFALQRLGCEVWAVNTVQFSNHLGYENWAGDVMDADHLARVTQATLDHGEPRNCDAILSGFLGNHQVGESILTAVERVRKANPHALYLCDPVMGDVEEGFYASPQVREFMMNKAVPAADVVTPNLFELEHLSEVKIQSLDHALEGVERLLAQGPRVVLLSSLQHLNSSPDTVEMLVATSNCAWRVVTPKLKTHPMMKGTGDLLAALFLAHFSACKQASEALGRTAAALFEVIDATHKSGSPDLQIIAAQDRLVAPEVRFEVERLA